MAVRSSCLLLFITFYSSAQFPISPNKFDESGNRTGNWTLLYDSAWKEVHTPDSTIYYRLIRFDKGKPIGKVRDFFKNGFRQWDGYYSSINPDIFSDGEFNFYHENGRLYIKRFVVNQRYNGPYFESSITGKLIAKGQYKDDLPEGPFIYYDEDGNIINEVHFQNGLRHGKWTSYHFNGKVKRNYNSKNDMLEGPVEDFNENGQLIERCYYKADKADGLDEIYYPTGQIKERINYKANALHGPYLEFFESGKPKSSGSHKNGLKDGSWTFHHPNGLVQSTGKIVEGNYEGMWSFYFESGNLSSKAPYHNHLMEGEWIGYFENGKENKRSFYKHDTLDGNTISYFESGVTSNTGTYSRGKEKGDWKYYFENKNLSAEGSYDAGNRIGLWKYYFESGQINAIQNFKDGTLDGEATNYYANGIVKEKANYLLGKKEGEFLEYFENGVKKNQAFYHNDLKSGENLIYYANGKMEERTFFLDGVEDGISESYYDNGNPHIIGTAKDGKMVGLLTAYYYNGKITTESHLVDGALNGPITFYDSITQLISKRGNYLRNEPDGEWINFDARGKKIGKEYFMLGARETQTFIQDSIQQLIDTEMYVEAFKLMPWLEKVTKRDVKDKMSLALPIHVKSKIYGASGDHQLEWQTALEYLKIIAKVAPGTGNHKTAIHNVATALDNLGRYDEALKRYDQAIEMARKNGMGESYWNSINNKVVCLYDAKRPSEAAALLESELTLANKRYGDSSEGWYIRHLAAQYYYDRPKDYKRAGELLIELLKDFRSHEKLNQDYTYYSYRKLGSISNLNDKVAPSIAYYDSAIAYAEKNSRTRNPDYFETLSAQYDNYLSLTDSVASKNRNLIIDKTKVLLENTSNYDLLFRMNRLLQVYEYQYSSSNRAIAYGEKAETACIKAKKENSFSYALLLQTQAWSIYYSDHRNDSLSEEKFIHAISIRKLLYGKESSYYYDSQLRLGSFYDNISQHSKAISIINEVLPLIIAKQDSVTMAEAYRYLGGALYNAEKYKQAIESYQRALAYYDNSPEKYKDEINVMLGSTARCYSNLKNYAEAKRYAEKGYQMALGYAGATSKAVLNRLDDLGWIHEWSDAFSEAQNYYRLKANIYKQTKGAESDNYISTIIKLASIHRKQEQAQKAIDLLIPYIKPVESKTASFLLYDLLSELANDYSSLAMYDQVEIYRKKIIALTKQLYRVDDNYAYNLRELGEFYRNRNRLDEAETILTNALNISKRTNYNQKSSSWMFFVSLGMVKSSLEKNKEAEALFLESIAITQKDTINSPGEYQLSAENLARFYSKMGRYKDAEKVLLKISSFVERTEGKTLYYYQLRGSLVTIYYRKSEYEKSKREASSIVKLVEEEFGSNHWLAINLHNNLGNVASATFDNTTAEKEFQHCIESYLRIPKLTDSEMNNLSVIYNNLADTYLDFGRPNDAEKSLVECDRLRKGSHEPVSLINQISTRRNWAKVHEEKGDHTKAETVWIELMDRLLTYTHENFYYMSDEEKAQFWKAQENTFSDFQSYASRRADQNPLITGTMYNIQLATKAILLSSSNKIRKRVLSSNDTSMVNMYYHWQHQRDQLAQLYGSSAQVAIIDSVKKKINILEKELNIAAEDQVEDKGGSPVNWKQIQSLLKPHEAAIEIIQFKHSKNYAKDSVIYAALIITTETKTAPALVLFPNGKLLEGRAIKYYKNAIAAHLEDVVSYANYWAPIEPFVKGKSRIYLSLDGVYNFINLNTLKSPSGEFLVDTKNFTLVSNTKDLLAIKGKKARKYNRANATLMGFPTYFLGREKVEKKLTNQRDFDITKLSVENSSGIADLPGTKIEIEKIQALLASHQWKVSTLMDETATENAVKEINQPMLLHIATHGYFTTEADETTNDSVDPMLRAGLLFTGAANFLQDNVNLTGNNGILTAYEASNLNLDNTDLVVLSACETGKGEVQNGEGVYGLQRAFQTAGAQAIIMSLWKVDDTATQELMSSFYGKWMNGVSKVEAFRNAQLQLKAKYHDPYYWGAFVMMGE